MQQNVIQITLMWFDGRMVGASGIAEARYGIYPSLRKSNQNHIQLAQ